MFRIDLSNLNFNINFEYVSVLILLISLIYMFVEKLVVMKRSKLFAFIIILNIISTTFDIFRAYFANKVIEGTFEVEYFKIVNALQVSHMLFLFIIIYSFSFYVINITCGSEYLRKKKLQLLLFIIPQLGVLIFTIANYFNPIMMNYTYDSTHKFLETNLFAFLPVAIIELGYLTLSIIYIFRFKESFDRKQILAIAFVPPIIAFGFIIVFIFPKYLIVPFMISMCVVIVQTTFESSEDMIDENTNLYNVSEFVRVLKRLYINHDKKSILLFKIINYSELMNKTLDED